MIRLLIVLVVLGATVYIMLQRQGQVADPQSGEVLYKQELDRAQDLADQMEKDADERLRQIDEVSR